MTYTVKQLNEHLRLELEEIYPAPEAGAIICRLFQHYLSMSRSDIYLQSGTNVPKTKLPEIENALKALKNYEPLQYVLGQTSFYGLEFTVNRHVLIPRPETEELVEWLLAENSYESQDVIDLGTGSGCIAISIKKNRPLWSVSAADISDEALRVASGNATLHQVHVEFVKEDMLNFSAGMMNRTFDLIVSNPPYVTMAQKEAMHANVLDYEPHIALFAPGTDPLIFYRSIAVFAGTNLKPSGAVYAELNEELGEETSEIFKQRGFKTVLRRDLHGKFRMLKAYRND